MAVQVFPSGRKEFLQLTTELNGTPEGIGCGGICLAGCVAGCYFGALIATAASSAGASAASLYVTASADFDEE